MHFPTFFTTLKSNNMKICEASPYYLFHPGTPERMKKHLPDVRLIVMLRNPIDRTYSHYKHSVRSGCEFLNFEEAINVEKERINLESENDKLKKDPKHFSFSHLMYSYLSRSEYANQLERWYRFFDSEQFLYIKSEEFFRNKTPVLQDVAKFLEIVPFVEKRISNQNINPGLNYVPIKSKTREYLREYFKPHNERLYQLIGRDLGWEDEN
jgi:hypothetical protein